MGFLAYVFSGLFLSESNQARAISPGPLLALGKRGLRLDLDVYGLAESQ